VTALAALSGAAEARTLYNATGLGDSIVAMGVGANGALAPLPGSPFASPGTPDSVVLSPDGSRLYSSNASSNGVRGYAVASDGSLTEMTGSPFAAGTYPLGLAMSQDGTRVFTANGNSGNVSAFRVAADGSLIQAGSPAAAGTFPTGIGVTHDGRFVYVTNQGDQTVSMYSVAADGSLTALPGPPLASVPSPVGLVVTPGDRYLYVENRSGPGTVSGFAIGNDGGLTALPGSPFDTFTGAETIAIDPQGRWLFVGGSSIVVFEISADGSLVQIPGSRFGINQDIVGGAALTPDGSRLYMGTSAEVRAYSIAADGSPTEISGSPFAMGATGTDFDAIALTPEQPPTAVLKQVDTVETGAPVSFDASASHDAEGQVARYDWDFGDGQTLANGGPAPQHAYPVAGDYTVKVTLTDSAGCSTTAIFDGQTVTCNGSGVASASRPVTVGVNPPANDAPAIENLRVKRKHFEQQLLSARGIRDRKPVVRFKLSEDAQVTFEVKPPRGGGKAPESYSADIAKGQNVIGLAKLLGDYEPVAGRYSLTATAQDAAGLRSKTAKTKFVVG
jgi:DNA-binding beta-propeller fold protein YncE